MARKQKERDPRSAKSGSKYKSKGTSPVGKGGRPFDPRSKQGQIPEPVAPAPAPVVPPQEQPEPSPAVTPPAEPTPSVPVEAPTPGPTEPEPGPEPVPEAPIFIGPTDAQISYAAALGIIFPPGIDIAMASQLISEAIIARDALVPPNTGQPPADDPNAPKGSNTNGWPPLDTWPWGTGKAGVHWASSFPDKYLVWINEAKQMGILSYAEQMEFLNKNKEGWVTEADRNKVWQYFLRMKELNYVPPPPYVNEGNGTIYYKSGVEYYQQGLYRSVTDPQVKDLVSYNGELMSVSRRRRKRSQDKNEDPVDEIDDLKESGIVPTGVLIDLTSPIIIGSGSTGLKKLVESDSFGGSLARIITSPITTGVLASILMFMLTRSPQAAMATRAGTIRITSQVGGKSVVYLRGFVGKSSKTGLDKLFNANAKGAATAARFATNTKSLSLTGKFLRAAGLSLAAAGAVATAVGTYPFSGFIQEEALQTTGLQYFTSFQRGDIEGMEDATLMVDEILAARDEISKVPFLNVMDSLDIFFDAVERKNANDKRLVDIMKKIQSGEMLDQYDQAHLDSRMRELEETAEEAHYYELIRNNLHAEAAIYLAQLTANAKAELKGGN